jgi:FkbM family methyltransferase
MLNRRALSLLPHFLREFLGLNSPGNLIINEKKIIVPIDIQGSLPNLFLGKSWKVKIIHRFNNISTGTFIDIGANLGQTLIEFWIANTFSNQSSISSSQQSAVSSQQSAVKEYLISSYIGFEPNQSCVRYLNSIIDINALQGYKIIPIGLFNESKSLSLYTQSDYDACATVVEDLRPERKYEIESVTCRKFDDVFAEIDVKSISLIKIDVEGAELEVLQGMSSTIEKLRPSILCEVLFTDKKADLSFMKTRNKILLSLLTTWNYSAYQLVKNRNSTDVQKCRKISYFSSEYWSLKNMNLCDYLFIPTEQEEQIIGQLLNSNE